jgi:uncharacterized membrane protein
MQRRVTFLDAVRGVALVLMVVNHTARDWMDGVMGWGRYYLIYGSLLLPAPLFLFLAGFCLPIARSRGGAPGRARDYARRGLVIVGAGYLLNAVVLTEQPVWSGGVLQTIGLALIVLGALTPFIHRRHTQVALLAGSVALYTSFAAALPWLANWSSEHPRIARALFNDFPPWPWIAPAALGLVLGWWWLEARARGPEHEARYFTTTAMIGAACLAAWIVWESLVPTTPRFGFPRDYVLNRHWTPRGATLLLIAGTIALLLAGMYALMERRGYRLRVLVILGQTALMLYFVHQMIELTLLKNVLGWRFNDWTLYGVALAGFLAGLVYLARLWLTVRSHGRGRGSPAPGLPLAR